MLSSISHKLINSNLTGLEDLSGLLTPIIEFNETESLKLLDTVRGGSTFVKGATS
jgi:hypothetical protein